MIMSQTTVIRYHDFCAGHTVTGHESKCRHLHGHNYRVHFHVRMKPLPEASQSEKIAPNADGLDHIGRVVDFSVVKQLLCEWLEENWDHRFLINQEDPRLPFLAETDKESLVVVNFNPTAENMARFLVETIGPLTLAETDVELYGVELSETRKCSVTYFK